MKYINGENLLDYAFLNEDTLKRPLKGICVAFHGYTDATMYEESPEIARKLGEKGIAWVFPYYSVWAWMGKNSQIFVEQVLDAVYERLQADESLPLLISGGSMGGLTALNYVLRGKRKATACAVSCPVVDMNFNFEDHPSFRRALLSAHIEKEGDLHEILKQYSPSSFAHRLPDIPYFLLFGELDTYYTQKHRPLLVEPMKQRGLNVREWIHPEMGHNYFSGHPEAMEAFCEFAERCFS
ncbi:MAG: prolyl oligopeptidase family serine peptidase [Clostridia bacterium]|nr:prolyl oligopeptidase family serine peptidase [Clostridia bacterium]